MPEYCAMSLLTLQDNISEGHGALVIGLTGGMGAGKSVVSQILRSLGLPVFDADAEARKLYDADATLLQSVSDRFGSAVLEPDGSLNRSELASVVFNDAEALADLNAMVHPAVTRAFASWKARAENSGAVLVFREAAILFESESAVDCDVIWAVTAPLATRVQRVQQRNGWSEAEIQRRMAHQWPADQIHARSDQVIVNDGSQALVPLVLSLIDELS